MTERQDHIGRILGTTSPDDSALADAPAVSAALIEFLERQFKAPMAADYLGRSPTGEALIHHVSKQAGVEEVLNQLRLINQHQTSTARG